MSDNDNNDNNKDFDKEYIDEAYRDVWGTQNPDFSGNRKSKNQDNDSGDNKNSRTITLKQPKDIEDSKLVKIATYNIDTEIINISLNSAINSSIAFTVDKKKMD